MYLCVMGMCLMKVHRDHRLLLRELACIPAEERNHTRFVVVRVFAQTLQDSKILTWATNHHAAVGRKGDRPDKKLLRHQGPEAGAAGLPAGNGVPEPEEPSEPVV